MSIDQFLDRRYDRRNYHCGHLLCDAWEAETGEPLRHALAGFLLAPEHRRAGWSLLRSLRPLTGPASPAIVLMRRPRSPCHVGMFIRGKVLHIREAGVAFQPLAIATFGFPLVGFYRPCKQLS